MNHNKKIAIIIPSCDKYSDVWSLLSQSYDKFWNDCIYKKYIITNSDISVPYNFNPINVWSDVDWSSNLIFAIKNIDTDYILLHIDDLIFCSNVNSKYVEKYVDTAVSQNFNYLQFINYDWWKYEHNLLEKKVNEPYRTSTIFSLRKKDILLNLLRVWENPRQFEVDWTQRSKNSDKWFFLWKSWFEFVNLIIKGYLEWRSLKKLEAIWLQYKGNRIKMSKFKNFIYTLKCKIFDLIILMPNIISKNLVKISRKVW